MTARSRSFNSALASQFHAYVDLKRALGRKFGGAEHILRHLDRFLCRSFPAAVDLSVSILAEWMAESPALMPQSRAVRLRVVRQFCLYLTRMSPEAFVPDPVRDWSLWPIRVPRRAPFIYSTEQIRALLRAALELPETPRNPHRPRAMFIVLLLLYTTGLRLSEAVHLQIGDVDFDAGTIRIRETKFFKTRLVPLAADVLGSVGTYIEKLQLPPNQTTRERALFVNERGTAYATGSIGNCGRKLLRSIGIKPAKGRHGPRIHDIRHSFAVHRIKRWYEEGANVQSLLPVLATYMGHKDIVSTQYYATVTVDILEHAGRRFERMCSPQQQGKREP